MLLTCSWLDARTAVVVYDNLLDLAKLIGHCSDLRLQQSQPVAAMLIVVEVRIVFMLGYDLNRNFRGAEVVCEGMIRPAELDVRFGLL